MFRFALVWLGMAGAIAGQQPSNFTPADIEEGSRIFLNSCAACHGPEGDAVPGTDLGRGRFRRASNEDELMRVILGGIPGTAMPPSNFSSRQVMSTIAYIVSLGSARGRQPGNGDVVRGRTIFEGKGECVACHRVNGKGSRSGPDLSDVGLFRLAANLEQSLTEPDAVILSQNRFVSVVTRVGDTVRGRLLNQDTELVQLMGADERPVTLMRRDLRSVTGETRSSMPSYKARLSSQELADVVAYLTSLRGLQ
jgi:putative heme-binding domain-containing protein